MSGKTVARTTRKRKKSEKTPESKKRRSSKDIIVDLEGYSIKNFKQFQKFLTETFLDFSKIQNMITNFKQLYFTSVETNPQRLEKQLREKQGKNICECAILAYDD